MELTLQMYLPIYLLMYFFVIFLIPTYRTYKKTGMNPVTFGKSDNVHDYIGLIMKALILLLFVNVLVFSLSEKLYSYLMPILYLKKQILVYVGLVLIHIALIWVSVAQHQMSSSWRIGIDQANKTLLVTKGIFSISRNPIFLGMIVSLLGLFLIIPNSLLFCLLVTTYLVIQIQIRLEEEFLTIQHQEDYLNYKITTRRLL